MFRKISKKISIILIIFSLLLIFYIFYKAEIVFSGEKFTYYSTYYFISFLILIFSISLFFTSDQLRIKIILIFFSTLITLYCAEILLTLKNNFYLNKKEILTNEYKPIKDHAGRTKIELYEELKKKKIKVNLYVPPIKLINFSDTILPLSSTSNVSNINCNENGFFPIYNNDRFGFNNPDEEWNKNNIEFLLIGDSFAHGDCVEEVDSLSSQLRTFTHSKSASLSLGHSGNGPLFEFATLREYFPYDKKVKKVVWLYYEANDLTNLYNEKKNNILLKYLRDHNFSQNLILHQSKIDLIIEDYFSKEFKLYSENNHRDTKKEDTSFLIAILKFREIRSNIFDKLFVGVDPDFKKILFLSNELAKKNDAKFYFVYIPDYFRYKDKLKMQSSSKKYNKILKIVNDLQIPLIDIKKSIEYTNNPLLYFSKNGVHFNELGYKLAAQEIVNQTEN